ncbi:hypothetical protein HMPREF2141_03504 [Bacteroides uniformis]|uniref:Uncharacterized protein n=1 Tax=Bacteroides uniformis (strain ATCC 8492 / DSM 6597 / CCUG 4942 / CIP 103695 / JCM 5828 / KCTC 5204 / NCTC 13054 / VPI 0061) TaxID=411479 RepID=A0ABC9NCV3_BACUC|nr:hypothetical protein BACUNI_01877 [Bacteroides uniformis ATCC 8492]KXT32125.1 hypothetical protein HMPREF2141_03504 [Bacteroides uniformis]
MMTGLFYLTGKDRLFPAYRQQLAWTKKRERTASRHLSPLQT